MSLPLIKYVLRAALRDRLILSLVILLVLGTSLSVFMGSAAVTEQDYFALVFAAGGLRFVGVAGLVLFVVFFIRRSFEARDVEYLLSRPVGRVEFLISYAASFSLLAIGLGAAQGLCLYIMGPHLFGAGTMLWVSSMVIENILMVNVALFFSMVLTSAASATMATFSFYVLARMMGQILGIIDSGSRGYDLKILEVIMQGISSVMPRLDLMGQSTWLIYGPDANLGYGFIFAQGFVFAALILLASLIDLTRRQF